ncbi:hypothetical protein [Rivularia sp. UHCC 0363]|uniref:hypothetical protein n=1 Tax=Rivularia sp. UHCC 0363 TaxID=3110244 RepID=UPI002B1F138F|nr:hypothetical protein [Rivularia sp. UHCC 0363]MEA5598643.1 hypothetical protein [Rivularia sp. UHCC 0363]
MHHKLESLTEDSFIILNDVVFNPDQIRNTIIQDFKPRKNDLNFCRKNIFLKKYFREVNNQGIFNRIEWKFCLKQDVECEIITFDERQIGTLVIKVILNFYTHYDTLNEENYHSEDFELKILLNYSQPLEIEETPEKNYIKTIYFKNINEQKTAYFYPISSEKICV